MTQRSPVQRMRGKHRRCRVIRPGIIGDQIAEVGSVVRESARCAMLQRGEQQQCAPAVTPLSVFKLCACINPAYVEQRITRVAKHAQRKHPLPVLRVEQPRLHELARLALFSGTAAGKIQLDVFAQSEVNRQRRLQTRQLRIQTQTRITGRVVAEHLQDTVMPLVVLHDSMHTAESRHSPCH